MYSGISYKVSSDYCAQICPRGAYEDIDWETSSQCSLGESFSVHEYKKEEAQDGKKSRKNKANTIDIVADINGEVLSLLETQEYTVTLVGIDNRKIKLPILQNEGNKYLTCSREKNTLEFRFINYLGRSRITFFDDNEERELPFIVVPIKIDYENDYITLTKTLAEKCGAILLEYSSPTYNRYCLSNDNVQTLHEQFIFLRQFCLSEDIQALFDSIKRNPDRVLIEDNEFKPLGCGKPSKKIYSYPFKYARKWNRYTNDSGETICLPAEVAVMHKRETLDTPANRFIKYSLERFNDICEKLVLNVKKGEGHKSYECEKEASAIHNMIDDILRDDFFDDIGQLDMVPQNNQILQKREGYVQIFQAYSMIELAMNLEWNGLESVYEGEARNIALLYEYWIFFELIEIISNIEGCIKIKSEKVPFIKTEKGHINIFLKKGRRSCQSFEIPRLDIIINLYYNRSFSHKDFNPAKYEGSYSTLLKPDYTLAIFPAFYKSETKALRRGEVSYVHFDAKYRLNNLTAIFGEEKSNQNVLINEEDEGCEDDEELLIVDDSTKNVISTYKNTDLLKMHAYNDGIRNTLGSYVLYPGTEDKYYNRYDERLPGVGAFAIMPSTSVMNNSSLEKFISEIISNIVIGSSRLNRIRYYTAMVMNEPASPIIENKVPLERLGRKKEQYEELCVLGSIRTDKLDDYYFFLEREGLLQKGEEFYFYFYAIKNGTVYSHHPDIFKATQFFTNISKETKSYKLGLRSSIRSCRLISRSELVEKLNEIGYVTYEDEHSADYYYIMKLKVTEEFVQSKELRVDEVDTFYGNDSYSPHSPKVIPLELLEN